ncbi:unnamed protein product [Toxocara canis]|uniref:Transcription elongation factor B polypeptide 2 n=1 Tax=Toxocara canis TaxID=6265 RepID=A0A183U343_TOXCA|nr:unnamed protein product [Toxocara canis]
MHGKTLFADGMQSLYTCEESKELHVASPTEGDMKEIMKYPATVLEMKINESKTPSPDLEDLELKSA